MQSGIKLNHRPEKMNLVNENAKLCFSMINDKGKTQ